MCSNSQRLRLQGNGILATISDKTAPVVWKSRVTTALGKYQCAIESALNADERASAAKNCAVASRKLTRFYEEGKLIPTDSKMVVHYYHLSAEYLQTALHEGRAVKSPGWVTDIKEKFSSLLQEIFAYARTEDLGKARVTVLMQILDVIKDDKFRGECKIEIGQIYFKGAVIAIEEKDFKLALSNLKDCYQPVEEAKVCGNRAKDEDILSEARILEKDVFLQTCIAESMQARFIGNDILDKAMKNYEDLPMPLVWDVIDWFRNAIMLAQEQDIEVEAMGHASIGKVYHRVLKMTQVGKKSYKMALEMVALLHPRSFNTQAWYQECTGGLADIQKNCVFEEEKRRQEERKRGLALVTEELKELDKHCDDSKDLLEFVYAQFPPKNPEHTLQANYKRKLKKTLCLAIQHYHPDRIDLDTHGLKWKTLCEEITKRLTNKLCLESATPITKKEYWVHESPNCGGQRRYTYRPLKGQVLRFRIKAPHNANVSLSSAPQDKPDMYEVLLSGWDGKESAIRKNKKQDLVKVKTPGYLTPGEFRGFWVIIAGNTIKVGREGDATPFMQHTDHKKTIHLTHYGFCTAWGATGAWTFSDDDPTYFGPGLDMTSLDTALNQTPPAYTASKPKPPPPTTVLVQLPLTPTPAPAYPNVGFTQPAPPGSGAYGQMAPPPAYTDHVGHQPVPSYPTAQPTPSYPAAQSTPSYPSSQSTPSYPATSPPLPLSWISCSGGSQCPSPVAAGPGPNPPLVVTANHQGGLIPGVLHPGSPAAHVPWGGVAQIKHQYFALSNSGGCALEWVPSSNGQLPVAAVQGGRTETGEELYIGRIMIGASYITGKVQPSHRQCYITNCGIEQGHRSYDVLCMSSVPLALLGVH